MEYHVTMTTRVPDGTPEQPVGDARAREAAHSRDLATKGQLLRLRRPPMKPGEWCSPGLFTAGDAGQLQQTLASMPLKIWRTDQVTPLAPHPNDPDPSTRPGQSGAEFLATFAVTIPDGTPRQAVEDAEARGRTHANWLTRDTASGCGHFRVRDSAEMEAIVKTLPRHPWMTTELTPLTPHPSDPATMSTRERRKP